MRNVTIQDLANDPNVYLQYMRDGEELVLQDGSTPIARILPFDPEAAERAREAQLVADGIMTMPEQEMDWDTFFALPAPDVPHDIAVQAAIESRGNW